MMMMMMTKIGGSSGSDEVRNSQWLCVTHSACDSALLSLLPPAGPHIMTIKRPQCLQGYICVCLRLSVLVCLHLCSLFTGQLLYPHMIGPHFPPHISGG